ncbi:uncharacterized protein LOC143040718 [Oratosquilla oratoria]|uniref:uncharacterized protein LOC143040718 n=1 Tax=Oratosquilla oratoria TaxID=337810 RepID=UPI003F773B40
MAMADNTEDNDPFEEDIVFDQAGLLGGRMPRSRQQATVGFLPTFMLFIRTVILCVAFLAMGLCTSVSGGPLIKLEIANGTEHSLAFHMYTARSAGMLVGGFIGALLFEVYNRQFLMFISLVWTAVSVTVLPFTVPVSLWWTFCSSASLGIGLGFFFTGGNVLCLDLWGRQGGASLQSLHFSFALGAFIAPLVIHPFSVGSFPTAMHNGSQASKDLSTTVGFMRNERALQMYNEEYGYEDYLEDFIGEVRVRRSVLDNNSSPDSGVTSDYDDTTVSSTLLSTLEAKELLNTTSVPPKEETVSTNKTKESTELQEEKEKEQVTQPPATTVHPKKSKPLKTDGILIGDSDNVWESPSSITVAKTELEKSTVPPVKTSPASVSTETGNKEVTTSTSVQTNAPTTKSVQVTDTTPSLPVPVNSSESVNTTPVPPSSNVNTQLNSSLSNITTEADTMDELKIVNNTSEIKYNATQNDTKVSDVEMTTANAASTQRTSQAALTAAASTPVTPTTVFTTATPPPITIPASTTGDAGTTSENNTNTNTSVTPPSTVEHVSSPPGSLLTNTSVKEDEPTTAPPAVAKVEGHLEPENSSNKEVANPPSFNGSYKTGGEGKTSDVENKNETEGERVPVSTDSKLKMEGEDPQSVKGQEGTGGKKLADTEEQESQQMTNGEIAPPEVPQEPEATGSQQGNQSIVDSGEETIQSSKGNSPGTSVPVSKDYSVSEPEAEPVREPKGETDDKPDTTTPPVPAGENSNGNPNTWPVARPGTYSDESEENHQFLDDVAQNYGVTKIQLAYISIGIFVILNSFVSVVVLCHNPREPRSKQDDGTLDEVNKGRMILFVVMFSMFMFMGEALQGAVHHLLTSTTTGTGLDVIEASGIDGQLLFWGLVSIIRFLCIFISGCLRLKPGKLLCSSALFTVIGTVFLAVGSFDKDDFLWAGIIVVALGLAPILPTSLLWMAQHMRITHRMCALMIILASAGNSLTHSLLTHVLGSSHLYAYILVTVSFISMLFLLISMCTMYTAQQSKTLGVPVGYQLANQHEEEDVLEMTPADSAVFNRNHHLVRENGESGQSLLLE